MGKKVRPPERTLERDVANMGDAATILERAKMYADRRRAIETRVLTGRIMERIRTTLGIPQIAVARDMGVSLTALRQWESGQSIPTEEKYQRVQDYFCVYTDDDVDAILAEGERLGLTQSEIDELDGLMSELLEEQEK